MTEEARKFGVWNSSDSGWELNTDEKLMVFAVEDEANEYAKQKNEADETGWRAEGLEKKHGPCFVVMPLKKYMLEAEFEEAAYQINLKLRAAVAALQEANRLREEIELPSFVNSIWLREELEDSESEDIEAKLHELDIGALESELENCGWSTSSSYC